MANKLYKFTFKTQERGAWDVYKMVDVKYSGIEVGEIFETKDQKWRIALQITASPEALGKNPNCPWMRIYVKQIFETEAEARTWLNDNRELVINKLYFEENN